MPWVRHDKPDSSNRDAQDGCSIEGCKMPAGHRRAFLPDQLSVAATESELALMLVLGIDDVVDVIEDAGKRDAERIRAIGITLARAVDLN